MVQSHAHFLHQDHQGQPFDRQERLFDRQERPGGGRDPTARDITESDVIAPYPPMPMPPPREPQSPEKTELPRRWPPPETPEAPADVPMPGVPDPSRPQPGI